jgi:hypothetical protein
MFRQADERKLDVDAAVKIIESTGDLRPVQWMVERFLQNPEVRRASAAAQLAQLMPALLQLAEQAGVVAPVAKKQR